MSDAKSALPIPERLVTRNLSKTKMTRDPRQRRSPLRARPAVAGRSFIGSAAVSGGTPPDTRATPGVKFQSGESGKSFHAVRKALDGPGIAPGLADFDRLARRKSLLGAGNESDVPVQHDHDPTIRSSQEPKPFLPERIAKWPPPRG